MVRHIHGSGFWSIVIRVDYWYLRASSLHRPVDTGQSVFARTKPSVAMMVKAYLLGIIQPACSLLWWHASTSRCGYVACSVHGGVCWDAGPTAHVPSSVGQLWSNCCWYQRTLCLDSSGKNAGGKMSVLCVLSHCWISWIACMCWAGCNVFTVVCVCGRLKMWWRPQRSRLKLENNNCRWG